MPARPYNQKSLCHPDKKHKAFGLCEPCWQKKRYKEYWRDRALAYASRNHKKNKLKKYRVTLEEYDATLLKQDGLCAICSGPPSAGRSLDIDHDHVTMKFRGLLCNACNTGIGKLKDSPKLLIKAAEYIERHF